MSILSKYLLLRLPDPHRKIGKRDLVLLSTLYATGARVQELCNVSVGDLRFGTTTIMILHGKGNKTHTIVIPEQCSKLLKSFIEQNHLNKRGNHCYLFSNQTHEHMTISCIKAIVKNMFKRRKNIVLIFSASIILLIVSGIQLLCTC